MVIHVCVPNTPFEHLDYLWEISDTLPSPPVIGTRVRVPFRRAEAIGIIAGIAEASSCSENKLRSVIACLDEFPIVSEKQYQLYRWVAQYYHVPLSEVLMQALPAKLRAGASIDLNISSSSASTTDTIEQPKQLNAEQMQALESILSQAMTYHCFLLQGVTGSGKTEVYLQAVQSVLRAGQQALILVPEIGLTPQLLERFQRRFAPQGYTIVLLHSALNDTERWRAWCAAGAETAQIIIGTRSAVFVPIPRLGLIVVDEEHDASFKQQDNLRYSARDTAIVRAQMQQIPIVLGSATPSLESLNNVRNKKYTLLRLTQRAAHAVSPTIQLIDMRQQKTKDGFSLEVLEQIKNHLERKEQVLVFVNRRGYAPVLLCHACGWVAQCAHCSVRLTVHVKKNYLQCHHCDFQRAIPATCEHCGKEALSPMGVGTERLETHLKKHFPEAQVLRIDRDSTRRKGALKEKLAQIHQGEVDILVGTQMLAKGHHFPHLTLVVMIDIDQGFFSHDFRAAEKVGQLILQVAGRAGREEKPGKVMIQTYVPDYIPLVTLLRDGYASFSDHLLEERGVAGFPPFTHMALLRCQSKKIESARKLLENIKDLLLHFKEATFMVLGPAPAPIEKKAGLYRMQLLLIAEARSTLAKAIRRLNQNEVLKKQRLRWSVDIDPIDLS